MSKRKHPKISISKLLLFERVRKRYFYKSYDTQTLQSQELPKRGMLASKIYGSRVEKIGARGKEGDIFYNTFTQKIIALQVSRHGEQTAGTL